MKAFTLPCPPPPTGGGQELADLRAQGPLGPALGQVLLCPQGSPPSKCVAAALSELRASLGARRSQAFLSP